MKNGTWIREEDGTLTPGVWERDERGRRKKAVAAEKPEPPPEREPTKFATVKREKHDG
jgi:hypothetical protein